MKDLKEKVIKKVELNDDNTIIVLTDYEGKKHIYEAYGDCCSYSWFSHINNLSNLLDSEILEVIEKKESFEATKEQLADKSGLNSDEWEFEYLQVYMYTFKTKKGYSDIEFRNDSNGYYGGSCEKKDEYMGELHEVKTDL